MISRNNIIVCCLGLFVSAWMSKGLFHIFYLAIFFVLPLAFPPCIGQEEETRTQQSFAALMAICYIVVMVESRPSLELQYLIKEPSGRRNSIVLGETTARETKNFLKRWEVPLRKYFLQQRYIYRERSNTRENLIWSLGWCFLRGPSIRTYNSLWHDL